MNELSQAHRNSRNRQQNEFNTNSYASHCASWMKDALLLHRLKRFNWGDPDEMVRSGVRAHRRSPVIAHRGVFVYSRSIVNTDLSLSFLASAEWAVKCTQHAYGPHLWTCAKPTKNPFQTWAIEVFCWFLCCFVSECGWIVMRFLHKSQ